MLYIHIGFHKTGSSTIQSLCSKNDELLKKHGVIYAKAGRKAGAHFGLTDELIKPTTYTAKRGTWHDLRREAENNGGADVLLSSEEFHNLSTERIAQVKVFTEGMDVRIVAYIRNTADFIVSRYGQVIRAGITCQSFDEFFSTSMAVLEKPNSQAGVFNELERWAQAFGWESMRVRLFDSKDLEDGDLVTDFLAALDLDRDELEPLLAKNSLTSRNLGLGWKSLELLRQSHCAAGGKRTGRGLRFTENFGAVRRTANLIRAAGEAAASRIGLDAEKGQYLTVAQWRQCRKIFQNELKCLNEKLGRKIPEPDWHEPPERPFAPSVDAIPAFERIAFAEQLLVELLPFVSAEARQSKFVPA